MNRHPKRLAVLAAALAATTLLGACAPLVLGGAFVGGVMVASDRRTSGAQLEDQSIELKAAQRVREQGLLSAHVNATSFNRQLLLTGEVATEADRTTVERAVATIDNVRTVVNELAIGAPSSVAERSSDTVVTTKIKASFVEAKDVFTNSVKVVTERGVVYLMGLVTEREANRATEIARGVEGVRKVVRVFEVISEKELAGTEPRSAPTVTRP